MLSLKAKCTCATKEGPEGQHFLGCDLMYRSNSYPRKKKRFFFFYSLKAVK